MITATMAYNYAKGKWELWSVNNVDNIKLTAEQTTIRLSELGQYLYPNIFIAELESYEYKDGLYSAVFTDDVEFPDVLTLEQSIAKNKKLLSGIRI